MTSIQIAVHKRERLPDDPLPAWQADVVGDGFDYHGAGATPNEALFRVAAYWDAIERDMRPLQPVAPSAAINPAECLDLARYLSEISTLGLPVNGLAIRNIRRAAEILREIAGPIPCPCTLVQQDESCPIGFPSLVCEICDGKGHVEQRVGVPASYSAMCSDCPPAGHVCDTRCDACPRRDLQPAPAPDKPPRHIVLTARLIDAIEDWRSSIEEFTLDRMRAIGRTPNGREILFRSIDAPSGLHGIEAGSFSLHASTFGLARSSRERKQHCLEILEQRRIPQIDDIAARTI